MCKQVFVRNLSYKNKFDLTENKPDDEINFHANGSYEDFNALTKKQKASRNLYSETFAGAFVFQNALEKSVNNLLAI